LWNIGRLNLSPTSCLFFTVSASLLTASALSAQGISPEATRQLTAVSEMGHSTIKPERLPRSLTFEEGDDPTIAAHPVAPHDPLPKARKLAEKAERLAKNKEREQSIEKYRRAVTLDPLYFQAWNNLALELTATGQTEEAAQVLRRLVQSNPEHVVAFTNLAAILSGQNRYADAEAVARQAMKLHNNSFSANYALGTALINQGKWSDEAKTKLQYAQVKYPEAKALLDHWPEAK
jgi:tetratricopeptide (TPR) repeat protein